MLVHNLSLIVTEKKDHSPRQCAQAAPGNCGDDNKKGHPEGWPVAGLSVRVFPGTHVSMKLAYLFTALLLLPTAAHAASRGEQPFRVAAFSHQ